MSEVIEVSMGKLLVSLAPTVITTGGLGSCIAACIYSPQHKKGALAHIMLPKSPEGTPFDEANTRFADVALGIILSDFQSQGISPKNLIAKIIGGANMFPDIQGRSQKVGERNIQTVKEIIASFEIDIEAEETGGHTGRAVSFDLSNGIVTVTMTI